MKKNFNKVAHVKPLDLANDNNNSCEVLSNSAKWFRRSCEDYPI